MARRSRRRRLFGSTVPVGLSAVNASESLGNVTVTATSSLDLTTGVFGVEYGENVYVFARSVAGAVKSQSITIEALDGVIADTTLMYRPYYNLSPLDPISSRVYGVAGEIVVP